MMKLAAEFAACYDIARSARVCGMRVSDARAALGDAVFRQAVDEAVMKRCAGDGGELMRRAAAEFERIAFGDDESCKPTDRIRAIEQLLKLTPPGDGGGELTILYDYRGGAE